MSQSARRRACARRVTPFIARFVALLAFCATGQLTSASAQKPAPHDSSMHAPMPMDMPGMNMSDDPLGVSMARSGSGTSWIPAAAPLPARQFMAGNWELMFQGIAIVEYDAQTGPRGASQLGGLSWAMLMATHALGGGRFEVRGMFSLDPLGVGAQGYPLLLQSGEMYRGAPLHDRQHPHDAFMELAVQYERALAGPLGISLYAAPVGEPALGPVAFPMRPSALDNPVAPLGHHWQDATHVTFGVLTAGVFTHEWKLEGSLFNGREPDDQRWNLDPIRLDSWSGRLSWSPGSHWSAAASYGYLRSPDALQPDVSEHRMTLSVLNGYSFGRGGQWSSALIWGIDAPDGGASRSNSALLEWEVALDPRNSVLGRIEHVQKSAEDLALAPAPIGADPDRLFDVSAFSLGYVREIAHWGKRGATIGIGALGTINLVPQPLRSAYGSSTPAGVMVFLRVRPPRAT